MLHENIKVFVVYVASLTSKILIYLDCKDQIALFITKKITIPAKYSDFTNIFSKKLAKMLLQYIKINKHAIKLEEGKLPLYRPINSINLVELKTFKTYIETILANSFIWPSKSPIGVLIFFGYKFNGSFYLCIDYYELNNLTIKNQYPLPLIKEFLD